MHIVYRPKGVSLVEQYRDAGSVMGVGVQRAAARNRRKRGRAVKIKRELVTKIRRSGGEFWQCLAAWAEGAGITFEEAVYLTADETAGCQTAMMRYPGGVALVHTEEELDRARIIERMTPPQVMIFRDQGQELGTLVYNDLIPGAGMFGWSASYAVACDTLYLIEAGIEHIKNPLLSNKAAWNAWHNGSMRFDNEGEFIDGYVVNLVRRNERGVVGEQTGFTRGITESKALGAEVGDYLWRTNAIYDKSSPLYPWRQPPRRFYKGGWQDMLQRRERLEHDLYHYAPSAKLGVADPEKVHRLILWEIGGKLREYYLTSEVGAVAVALVGERGVTASVGIVSEGKVIHVELFL